MSDTDGPNSQSEPEKKEPTTTDLGTPVFVKCPCGTDLSTRSVAGNMPVPVRVLPGGEIQSEPRLVILPPLKCESCGRSLFFMPRVSPVVHLGGQVPIDLTKRRQ